MPLEHRQGHGRRDAPRRLTLPDQPQAIQYKEGMEEACVAAHGGLSDLHGSSDVGRRGEQRLVGGGGDVLELRVRSAALGARTQRLQGSGVQASLRPMLRHRLLVEPDRSGCLHDAALLLVERLPCDHCRDKHTRLLTDDTRGGQGERLRNRKGEQRPTIA